MMFFRVSVIAVLMALVSAFKRTPMQMNMNKKISAAVVAAGLVFMPSSSFAVDLNSPVQIEKKAKFTIGAGVRKDFVLEKKAKFTIGAGVRKDNVLEKKAKFSIGAGVRNSEDLDLDKKAKFTIGAGVR
mmetsp:Transcript_20753/g.20104  ORF Transcript_20753/g.20104 Transcript_20753/m.20104 type:complete len:129 (+) Transcript_20753:44-430(+)